MKLSFNATLKRLGLTKKDFSLIVGISPVHMSRYNNNIDELPIYIRTILELLMGLEENKRFEYIDKRLKEIII